MAYFYRIFTLIKKWDIDWSTYRVANFWEVNAPEMEVIVQNSLTLLNKSMKFLNDENWKIIEITRDNVDAVKQVLPLISDLKNTAMRIRHWDEVREVIKK